MKYLILISLSFLLSCGYEHSYQASIDKQAEPEELCKLRDWAAECYRDAYSLYDIKDCTDVFKKRQEDIGIRYHIPPSSQKQMSRTAKGLQCVAHGQSLYDMKRCIIRLHEDMKRLRGC